MPHSSSPRQLSRQRRAMYGFGGYNPYRPSEREWPLVEENLARLKSGQITLRGFLRQTPQFARWQEEHLQQARVLLVTNEPGLSGSDKLYGGLALGKDAESVAEYFRTTMLSWLALSNHPRLKAIHGESPWMKTAPGRPNTPAWQPAARPATFSFPVRRRYWQAAKSSTSSCRPFPRTAAWMSTPATTRTRNTTWKICRRSNGSAAWPAQKPPATFSSWAIGRGFAVGTPARFSLRPCELHARTGRTRSSICCGPSSQPRRRCGCGCVGSGRRRGARRRFWSWCGPRLSSCARRRRKDRWSYCNRKHTFRGG